MKAFYTIGLVIISNIFMSFVWFRQLKFHKTKWLGSIGFFGIVLVSWCIAFFKYSFMIPAYKIGI